MIIVLISISVYSYNAYIKQQEMVKSYKREYESLKQSVEEFKSKLEVGPMKDSSSHLYIMEFYQGLIRENNFEKQLIRLNRDYRDVDLSNVKKDVNDLEIEEINKNLDQIDTNIRQLNSMIYQNEIIDQEIDVMFSGDYFKDELINKANEKTQTIEELNELADLSYEEALHAYEQGFDFLSRYAEILDVELETLDHYPTDETHDGL